MDFKELRQLMVDVQLVSRGIKDKRVLAAFMNVPRHEFLPADMKSSAYEDCPLPIGNGQTISQPYMVALMSEILALKGTERVLEIGTGSGYQAAILSELAREVYSVERIEKLAHAAEENLKRLGYFNVHIHVCDGSLGLSAFAPYDGIIVTAGAPRIPASLIKQLKEGGRLVIPVGGNFSQVLTVAEKKKEESCVNEVCGCIFVPLIGEEGWKSKR